MAERKGARATDRFRRKREAILDASIAILNQKGVKGLTLADAAAAVGFDGAHHRLDLVGRCARCR